ncbi:phage tail protein [Paraburkholderia sp. J12]|uniref:phage tail protein n=1 Tax=Paraburkholderia sp. J12 TaxID=2805432 RepID=UPI002ABDB490|nr:phage tail protein [Paraburkholderia sp. J12]
MGTLDNLTGMAAGGNMPTLMVLGSFQFSINTIVFQEWARKNKWKWGALQRMGQFDALQFLGPENDTLDLPGVLYPRWKGDINSLDTLRSMGDAGQPYQLVDSMGYTQGRWIIEGLDETQKFHDVDGTPKKVEFTLSLKLYDEGDDTDDGSAILSQVSSAASAATGANASAVSGFSSMVSSIQSTAAATLGTLKSAVQQVQTAVAPVLNEAASVVGAVNRSIAMVNDVKSATTNIEQQVKAAGNVAGALSGAKTLLGKVSALGIQATSATAVIGNVSSAVGGIPQAAQSALQTANAATVGATAMLNSAQSDISSFISTYT